MTYAELERVAFAEGWRFVRTGAGSARIYRHPARPGAAGVLVLDFHKTQEVKRGTLAAALKRIHGPKEGQ